jgi:hypothetical protein
LISKQIFFLFLISEQNSFFFFIPKKLSQTSFKFDIIQTVIFVSNVFLQKIYTYIYVYIYVFDVAPFFYFSSPLPHTSAEETIFVPIVVYILIFIFSLFIPGDVLYAWCQNKYNVHLLNKTVEKGTRPDVKIPEDKLV